MRVYPPLWQARLLDAALNKMLLGAEERRIMTEVQNFYHYAKMNFPCFKVLSTHGETDGRNAKEILHVYWNRRETKEKEQEEEEEEEVKRQWGS